MNKGFLTLTVMALLVSSCQDERALVVAPDTFKVEVSDQLTVISDTFVVNMNEKITFNFPKGCPDEILFYPGESGKEYRFGSRSMYQLADSTLFESKVTVTTTINTFDATIVKDFALVAVSGLTTPTTSNFNAATKTELMKLRATSVNAAAVTDNFSITATSTPINLTSGDLNIAISAKSAEATKNFLSISAAGLLVTNSETRNYGFVKNGVTVVNTKKVDYPIVANTLISAAWGQYAPDSTIAPGSAVKVLNATGYSWNLGEIGVSYAPAITGGTLAPNKNGVALASSYPIAVSAPLDLTKVVDAGVASSEAWLVSRGLNPCAVTADVATVVKRVDQSSMNYFQYIYKEKGVYKASLVGINVGTNGTAKVVREFVILVKGSTDTL